MKKLALVISLAAAINASAFSLDFTGVSAGTTIAPDLTLSVPGYGSVTFSAAIKADASGTSELVVGDTYVDGGVATRAIEFDGADQMIVTFNGTTPSQVDFDIVGASGGEEFNILAFGSNSYLVNLQGSGDGAGVSGVSWNSIPEPSTSILGLIGGLAFLARRKR